MCTCMLIAYTHAHTHIHVSSFFLRMKERKEAHWVIPGKSAKLIFFLRTKILGSLEWRGLDERRFRDSPKNMDT